MAFEIMKKGEFRARRKVVDRVSFYNAGGGAVSIILSEDLVERLGSPDFVSVGLGTGTNAGQIMIKGARARDGNYKLSGSGGKSVGQRKFAMSPGRLGMTKEKHATTTLQHKMTKDGLIVWVPKA